MLFLAKVLGGDSRSNGTHGVDIGGQGPRGSGKAIWAGLAAIFIDSVNRLRRYVI